MARLELASSWSRRAHYSANLTAWEERGPAYGRSGTALCNGATAVYDQARMNQYGYPGQVEFVTVAELPLCKRCARFAVDPPSAVPARED